MKNHDLRLTTFQIGNAPKRWQGLRIGTTRRPPRGVRKSRWIRDGYFDVWLPALAPSAALIRRFKGRDFDEAKVRRQFAEAYEHELLSTAVGRQNVEFIAQIARAMPLSIGCYCEDEKKCHRSRLFKILMRYA